MKLYVIFLFAVILPLWGCKGKKTDSPLPIVRPVKIAQVNSLRVINKLYTGIVEAEEFSLLAFKLSGPLVSLPVEEGQKVSKGEIIAEVDPLDYRLQYESSRAAFLTAQSQLERSQRLLAMQAISKQEYEIAEANYIRGKSAHETALNTLQNTRLRAPFDGFVERKYVENYQKVMTGESIIKLVNPRKLAVRFTLPETSVDLLQRTIAAAVEFDTYKGRWFKAKIKEFVDASPDGTGIPVKLSIDDSSFFKKQSSIYPGFSCKVNLTIDQGNKNEMTIPISAIFKDSTTGETCVWIYQPAQKNVRRRGVQLGPLIGTDRVTVISGLQAEEYIVIAGVNYITEGEPVKVLNE